jgi:hypothetical protein
MQCCGLKDEFTLRDNGILQKFFNIHSRNPGIIRCVNSLDGYPFPPADQVQKQRSHPKKSGNSTLMVC